MHIMICHFYRKAIQFYRGPDYDVSEEFNEIRQKHLTKVAKFTKSWKGTLKRMTSMAFLKPYMCIGVLYALIGWTGYDTMIIYMGTLFKESSFNPETAPIIIGCAQILIAGLTSLAMNKASPNILFVTCQIFNGIALGTVGIYTYLRNSHPDLPYLNDFGWIPLTMMIVMVVARSAGILPVMHVLLNELFPTDIRTQSIGVTQSISLMFGAAGVKLFPNINNMIGFHGTCMIYSLVTFFSVLWGAITIPDNRGKSLVKVEEHYETNVSNKVEEETAAGTIIA
jgi:hypothetical protein